MKVILIGRHTPDFGGLDIEVVEQKNVTWPETSGECEEVLNELLREVEEKCGEGALLLQNTPSQLAIAIANKIAKIMAITGGVMTTALSIGVVVSKAVPAQGNVSKEFFLWNSNANFDSVSDAIRFANPRAEVEMKEGDGKTLVVSVDPPRKFEFSHIEWL